MQLTPAFIDDPYALYAQLLQGPRMFWTELWDGAWLVSRYADVIEVLRAPGLSAQRADHFTATLTPEQIETFRPYLEAFSRWMLFQNPPRHTEIRRPLNKAFVPSALAGWQPQMERLAAELIDAQRGRGTVDFISTIASPYPARMIGALLGLDAVMDDTLVSWSDDIAGLFGSPVFHPELAARAQKGLLAIHEHIRGHLPAWRAQHAAGESVGLVGALLDLEAKGTLDEEGLLSQFSNLIFGGHETVRRSLGNGLHALLSDRAQWERLVADPEAHVAGAVREILRYDASVQVSMRVATEDGVLLDQAVKAGDRVAVLVGAGNRDPRKFDKPDVFDITRDQGPPLTFGFGPHACIGAAMGRMEMEIMLRALAERAPDIELAEAHPPRAPNPVFRGFARLPVVL